MKEKEEAEQVAVEKKEAEEKAEQEKQAKLAVEAAETKLTAEKVKEIIEYSGLSEGDSLISVSVEGDEIKAVIELEPSSLFSTKELIISNYTQVSDALLDKDDWQVLTVNYGQQGTIRMNRTDTVTTSQLQRLKQILNNKLTSISLRGAFSMRKNKRKQIVQ